MKHLNRFLEPYYIGLLLRGRYCMKPKQESDRFLSLAYADRDACIALSKIEDIKSHIICFHAQQAIEKALKAVIMIKNRPMRRTHDLFGMCVSSRRTRVTFTHFYRNPWVVNTLCRYWPIWGD
ncbi:MAG: hypothetical protein CVV33_08675 [Methanomicrobiales archaeon HGW-Methanomicrobiales-4]|nr:MAG: hypothetical protein CVV33_08675 [Methanomicrobiales archaeon HGW-Methanomicrobiales-4]